MVSTLLRIRVRKGAQVERWGLRSIAGTHPSFKQAASSGQATSPKPCNETYRFQNQCFGKFWASESAFFSQDVSKKKKKKGNGNGNRDPGAPGGPPGRVPQAGVPHSGLSAPRLSALRFRTMFLLNFGIPRVRIVAIYNKGPLSGGLNSRCNPEKDPGSDLKLWAPCTGGTGERYPKPLESFRF